MINFKFSKMERWAGVFLVSTFTGFLVFVGSVCVRQGWFEKKVRYQTYVPSADGLREGADVQMTGLNVGKVDSIEFTDQQGIRVNFSILEKFAAKIKKDASLYMTRPFIIGEKQIEINPGSTHAEVIAENSEIPNQEVFDVMAALSGKKLNTYVENVSMATKNLTDLLKALTSEKRTRSLVRTFDRIEPLMQNVDVLVGELSKMGSQLNQDEKIGKLVTNLTQLTEDFQGLGATIKKMGPQLPETSQRAVEALNETVVVLKALQKSFIMRSNVEEVRREEKARIPASQNP